jgi:YfiH family protein
MPLEGALPVVWDAPPGVGALMSTRHGGVSAAPYASLNLGVAVGDVAGAVAENRRRFATAAGAEPVWLRQVHGCRVVRLGTDEDQGPDEARDPEADAAWTDRPGRACVVQVADCLPLLLAHRDGRAVAAAHAGWRGLAAGVVEETVRALCEGSQSKPQDLLAWIGPCIGPRQFEVGADVLAAFPGDARHFSSRPRPDGAVRWLADLPALARNRLARLGVQRISGGGWCTVEHASRFFSFRRDGVTGRMAAAIWRRGD